MEKWVQKHLQTYLLNSDFFSESQFGFRPKHSCESALLCMVDDWATEVDRSKFCGVAFIDMRKAFDSVNYDVLLNKLSMIGCSENALAWFKSYFCFRDQLTEIGGKLSNTRSTISGVPQGSVLGPLLFTIYINDLVSSIKSGKVVMFADDATLYVSGSNLESVESQLNSAMNEVYKWTSKNRLVLNDKKTKVMLLGSRQRLNTLQDKKISVIINGTLLECVSEYKCLGVSIDDTLTFKSHVTSIAKVMKQKLGLIRRNKYIFNVDQLKRLYWGFVLPHALYCSTVWSSSSESNYKILNTLHKRAAYIVSGYTWETSSETVFRILAWPTLKELFNKSISCMVYKCVSGVAPSQLSSKFVLNDNVSTRVTRSTNRLLLRIPQCKTQFYRRTFVPVSVNEWNCLSDECRSAQSLAIFKKCIKPCNK